MEDCFKAIGQDISLVSKTNRTTLSEISATLTKKIDAINSKLNDNQKPNAAGKANEDETSSKHEKPTELPKEPNPEKKNKVPKSRFLQKPKILYIGESIANNANFAEIEKETQTRIKTVKAYSSVLDVRARFPKRNVKDVTPVALGKAHEDDVFTHLVLAAPSVDITNMDTSKINVNDDTEVFKKNIVVSCENMVTVAENALKDHPNLKNVIIMEHADRYDDPAYDPTGLKPKLAKFANITLSQLLNKENTTNKIQIGKHNLDYTEYMFHAIYKEEWSGKCDGLHMKGAF